MTKERKYPMKKTVFLAISALLTLLGLFVLAFIFGADIYTEYLWYASFEATVAFWAKSIWQLSLWVVGSAAAFIWFWFFGLGNLRRSIAKDRKSVV